MKILLISSPFPPQIGGVENVVNNLAKKFKDKGNEVMVITSLNLDDIAGSLIGKFLKGFFVGPKERVHNTIKVNEVFLSLPRSLLGLVSFPYRFFMSVIKVRSVINKYNPDIVNLHFPDDSLYYTYFSTLFTDIPIVINIHGNEIHLFSKSPFYRFLLSKLFSRSKKIIVNSNYMKNELLKVYPSFQNKVKKIRNGIKLDDFKKTNNIDVEKNSYYFFIGRFDDKKGLDVLIKAFNKVAKRTNKKLLIAGSEVEMGKPLSYFKDLVETDKIEFLGWVTNEQKTSYLKNAYYSVFPSRIEPFGIVALESMACGTPVLASNTGGFKDIISKTNAGVLFKKDSIKDLSDTIMNVDGDSEKRQELSKNALSGIKRYTWEEVSSKYLEVFSKYE